MIDRFSFLLRCECGTQDQRMLNCYWQVVSLFNSSKVGKTLKITLKTYKFTISKKHSNNNWVMKTSAIQNMFSVKNVKNIWSELKVNICTTSFRFTYFQIFCSYFDFDFVIFLPMKILFFTPQQIKSQTQIEKWKIFKKCPFFYAIVKVYQ